MKETKLYSILRPHLGECDRVENILVSGMADVFYNMGNGITGWVETKLIKSGLIYFEKFQPQWISKHSKIGARIWIIAMDQKETIYFYQPRVILSAPRTLVGKWITVRVTDIVPYFEMYKPYRSWGQVHELLSS